MSGSDHRVGSRTDGGRTYRYFPGGTRGNRCRRANARFRELADLSEEAVVSSATPLERFRAVAEAYVAFARNDAVSYRMLFSLMQTGDFPELRKEARRRATSCFAPPRKRLTARNRTKKGACWHTWRGRRSTVPSC